MKTISKLSVARYHYNFTGEYEKSLAAIEEFLREKPNHRKALQLRAGVTTILGRLPDAIQSYKQALSLCKPVRDCWARCSMLESIGSAYWRLKQPDLAIKYKQTALELYEAYYQWGQDAFEEPMATNLWDIGGYQTKSGKFSEAIATYEKLLENLSKGGSLYAFAEAFYELGSVHYQQNDLDKALSKFLSAAKIFESLEADSIASYSRYFIGCIYFVKKEFKQALIHIKTSIAFLENFYATVADDQEAEDDKFYYRAVRLRNSLEWKGPKIIRYLRSLLLPKKIQPSSSSDNWSEY